MREEERYQRQIILNEVGEAGQRLLESSKVLIVGAGGLGCPAIQSLTISGIGHIGIIDGDDVELSNLHRQPLFIEQDIGQNKAIAAARKAKELNPGVTIKAFNQHLDEHFTHEMFEEYDIILDGTDNFETRYLTNDLSIVYNKPLVSGAVFKHEGQVTVFNYQEGPSYRCLFPDDKSLSFGCVNTGVLCTTTSIIGNMMAMEVLKIVLGTGFVLSGKLMTYNALKHQQLITSFERDPEQIQVALNKALTKSEL